MLEISLVFREIWGTRDSLLENWKLAAWFHLTIPPRQIRFPKGGPTLAFAPIHAEDGTWLHTYYVASTAECAYIESVLHEIPLHPPGSFDEDELRHYYLARVV